MMPFPAPDAAPVIVNQDALLTADQVTPAEDVVTWIAPDRPAAAEGAADGLRLIEPVPEGVIVSVDGNARACRSLEVKVTEFCELSASVTLMRYCPGGLN